MSVCSLFAVMYEGRYFISSHRMVAENRVITKTPFKTFEVNLNVRMKFRIHSSLSFPRTALKGEWGGLATIIFSYTATSAFRVSLQSQHLLGLVCCSSQCTSQSAGGMGSSWGECVPGVCEVLGLSPQPQHCKNQECWYRPISPSLGSWRQRGLKFQGYPQKYIELEATLGYVRSCLQTNKQTQVPTRETECRMAWESWTSRSKPSCSRAQPCEHQDPFSQLQQRAPSALPWLMRVTCKAQSIISGPSYREVTLSVRTFHAKKLVWRGISGLASEINNLSTCELG